MFQTLSRSLLGPFRYLACDSCPSSSLWESSWPLRREFRFRNIEISHRFPHPKGKNDVTEDTFVVRTIVTPALTAALGEANWWPRRYDD